MTVARPQAAPAVRPAAAPAYAWGRGPWRAGAAATAGAALACAFPEPGFWPLAVPALAVLFALFATAAPRRALQEGFVAGFVYFGLLLRWFAAVLLVFTDLGGVVAAGAVAGAGIIEGTLTALLAWTVARLARRFGAGPALAAAPVLWVAYDVLRGVFPVPFPWATLSAAFAAAPGAPEVAAVAGAHGFALALAAGAACLAAWLVSKGHRRPALRGLLVWGGLLLGLFVAGRHALGTLPDTPPLRVAVLQASLREDADPYDELATYERLTDAAAAAGARVIVWPESAVGFRIDTGTEYRRRMEALARRLDVDLVLGSVTGRPGGGYYNSDALVRPDRGLAEIQPKRQLVPFGEYMPARFLLGNIPALAVTLGEDFHAGDRPVTMVGRHATYGALVCFEGVFPQLAKGLAQDGAALLVNTTNDSWYGWSSGPYQHLAHTVLRAPETGRPLLRAANSGISVIVDRDGRVLRRLELGEQGVLVADVRPGTALPPGATAGWVAGWACAMFGLAALLAAIFLPGGKTPGSKGRTTDA